MEQHCSSRTPVYPQPLLIHSGQHVLVGPGGWNLAVRHLRKINLPNVKSLDHLIQPADMILMGVRADQKIDPLDALLRYVFHQPVSRSVAAGINEHSLPVGQANQRRVCLPSI